MGKRKAIPAALHSEFTEYSSLIRALRTNNSLDVTSHITKPPPHGLETSLQIQHGLDELDDEFGGKDGDGFNDIEDGHESSNIETAPLSREISPSASGPSSSVEPMSSRKRKRSSMTPSYPRRRNAWTRWPLLADDVYVPEWSLEDEISLLAANVLKLHPRPPLPVLPSQSFPSSDDHDQGDGDIPSYLPPLTHSASTYLSTILALLIAHTPNRPLSQQNRIEPIGWRAVLDMLSSCGDPSVANQKCVPATCFYSKL